MGAHRNGIYDDAYNILYLSGLSLSQVAHVLKVTRQCVYKAFKKRNFQLRTVHRNKTIEYDGKLFSQNKSGYYALTSNDRCLLHRYVWEKEIGPIPPGFDIHHKNLDKSDNSIGNLECLSKSNHTRIHHKMARN